MIKEYERSNNKISNIMGHNNNNINNNKWGNK